jgi:hypothetical protein
MLHRPRFAALSLTILAAACLPTETAPLSSPGGGVTMSNLSSTPTPEAVPLSLTITPSTVIGGDAGTPSGTVAVEAAVSFDRILQVATDNPSVLPFLSSSTVVPAFSTRAGVQLIPAAVSSTTVVKVLVTGGGVTVSADLTVEPPGSSLPGPTLASMSVSPATVNAGDGATGTITLPSAAPSGGVVVSLFSRIPGSATVPPSVTVPAGATKASFPIATFAGFPNSTTSVLLTATNQGTLVASSITVVTGDSPSSGGTVSLAAPKPLSPSADQRFPLGASVTFDWSDVAGAASYTIQIDDRDSFSAPLVATQMTTTSQFTTATLPRTTMWWRVRATSATGATSAWSSARRFEVK